MAKLSNTPVSVDPVCGMVVEPGRTRLVANYQGHSYWFCAEDCRGTFEAGPKNYLGPKPAKRIGFIGRYLERLARTNEKAFGGGAPKCH